MAAREHVLIGEVMCSKAVERRVLEVAVEVRRSSADGRRWLVAIRRVVQALEGDAPPDDEGKLQSTGEMPVLMEAQSAVR